MSDTVTTYLNALLDRYTVQEKLGTGGMARVYRGYDNNLDRDIAVKVMHEHLVDDTMFKERFEREAKFIAALNHPNIVQIYDYAALERDGNTLFYMVMSYIPGPTLRDILEDLAEKEEQLPQERIVSIIKDVNAALGYAHEKGMIHRDVKPANIIIDEQTGRAVLTDFGIARLAHGSKLTQEGVTVGTPAYMSPEQATGEPIDARSDLYALGVILYEMLAGEPPFEDDGSLSVLLKHLNEPVPALSERTKMENPYLDAVIFKALAKKPEDRYQTADHMIEDLETAVAGDEPQAMATAHNHTQPLNAIPTPTAKINSSPGRPSGVRGTIARSPLGILAIGMAALVSILIFSILMDEDANTTQAEDNQADSIQVDESLMPLFFSTNFTPENVYTNAWPLGVYSGLEREIIDEGYIIRNTQVNVAVPSIFEDSSNYGDISIQMRGKLDPESARASAYGVIFHYINEDNYNVFAVDGLGRYSIWLRSNGDWTELRNPAAPPEARWTRDENINPLGEENTLRVDILGDQLIGYVNNTPVAMVRDATIATGRVGIYVASNEEANATAIVDMFAVMVLQNAGSESMTGDESINFGISASMVGPDDMVED